MRRGWRLLFLARRHLGQVGNNLNQVARVLNSGGRTPELDAVLAVTKQAVQRVQLATDQLIGRSQETNVRRSRSRD